MMTPGLRRRGTARCSAGGLAIAAMAIVAAGAAAQRSGPIVKGSGAAMCAALTQADFATAGIHVNAKPSANVQDDGASAYCVYSGRSGAMGGVELDIFWPAGKDAADVAATEQTVLGDGAKKYASAGLKGVDDSRLAASLVDGGPPFAAIVVRRADLVFTISLPAGPKARAQLLRLSAQVLQRLP